MVNGWRLTAVILAVLLTIAAASGIGLYFVWRSEAHLALRQARNVWTALRMIGLEYYGAGDDIYDERTFSGLKEEVEQEVYDVTECEGNIVVLGNVRDQLAPDRMLYREGAYLVYYYVDENNDRQWQVYRANSIFSLDSSAQKNFGA